MSVDPAPAADLLLVTVAARGRRADLALPAAAPVAELVPGLARLLGVLDRGAADGARLVVDGRTLDPAATLAGQGVADGALLHLLAGAAPPAPRVYDDDVEAVADAVAREVAPRSPVAVGHVATAAGTLLGLLGAVALLPRGTSAGAGVAAVAAVVLLSGAMVLGRTGREEPAPAAWLGVLLAAAAGVRAAPALPLVGSGAGCLVAGLAVFAGLGGLPGPAPPGVRARMLPPVAVGAVLLGSGLLVRLGDFDPAVVLTTVLVLVVLGGSVAPWLALAAGGRHSGGLDRAPPGSDGVDTPVDTPVDTLGAAELVRSVHELLVALALTVGVLLVLVAPLAVRLGAAGAALALGACVAVALRTRQYAAGAEVLVGLVSAVLGLASTAVAVLLGHPDWRPAAATLLVGVGVALLVVGARAAPTSVRLARLGDVAESAVLLALLPLLVVATGLVAQVRG